MEKTLYFYHIFIILKDNIIKLIVASTFIKILY